jgi:hypothetical protein
MWKSSGSFLRNESAPAMCRLQKAFETMVEEKGGKSESKMAEEVTVSLKFC